MKVVKILLFCISAGSINSFGICGEEKIIASDHASKV